MRYLQPGASSASRLIASRHLFDEVWMDMAHGVSDEGVVTLSVVRVTRQDSTSTARSKDRSSPDPSAATTTGRQEVVRGAGVGGT